MQRWITTPRVVLLVILVLAVVVGAHLALGTRRSSAPVVTPVADPIAGPVGADASWPVCTPPHGTKRTLPLASRPAFAIVGINDGLPGTRSACIERELRWAAMATGGSAQPLLSYYVMAADPWAEAELRWVKRPLWPSSNRAGGFEIDVPAAYRSGRGGAVCGGGHGERACAYVK